VFNIFPPPGKNPRSWGGPFWIVLHVAFHGETWENDNVRRIHDLMPDLLPCATCRKNHGRFRRDVESKMFAQPGEWVNEAHNFVNAMHNRDIFTYDQCVTRTQSLYFQPWIIVNAFFKMCTFLISHYQTKLRTPELISAFCQLLPFHPKITQHIENITKLNWGESKDEKLFLLKKIHEVHLTYVNNICVPSFEQYIKWISEASYGGY